MPEKFFSVPHSKTLTPIVRWQRANSVAAVSAVISNNKTVRRVILEIPAGALDSQPM